ncbi:helix-turn-helix domain-containing protein [Schinkia azotoformans]|uniref:DNA binding domain-containing protein n=1 Tax=Schinkia azotoformans LMG 9581 TaxID=1131731 RepID=K6DIH3_SCHAZ|nr:helix-turn-helix domain-containing protein [Schinkia azotoformans]EKN68094.1 DNA binding domain-containing protein [Schinkia azotoformans LMG 9581]MEC1638096.1 helix-turn-helix domain-containing protein [Schinkia azotoformans]MEC1946470.1 helix-turn-helix domain-containing protein [Schinkia azotoformans]MED4351920.1 helix-turn-helix domain-containing protein [Schinkia azotoformans]
MRYEDLKDVLTVKDIMEFLGISRAKAYELVNSGEFHTVRVGTRILIPKISIQKWLEGEK